MYDVELEDLQKRVTNAATFAKRDTLTKHEVYLALKSAAKRLARDNESPERAFCRLYVDRNAPYAKIYLAYSARPGTATIAKAQPMAGMGSGDADDGDGRMADDTGPSFSSLVDDHQARNPSMTRSASVDSCMSTSQGRRALSMEKRRALAGAR